MLHVTIPFAQKCKMIPMMVVGVPEKWVKIEFSNNVVFTTKVCLKRIKREVLYWGLNQKFVRAAYRVQIEKK